MRDLIPSRKPKWYGKNGLVAFWCVAFFPVGLYGLWKSDKIAEGWKLGVSFFYFVLFCVSVNNSSKQTRTPTAASVVVKAPMVAGIGEEVPVGNFIYRVNKAYFTKSLGNHYSRRRADGIFLVVDLSLKNVGNEQHMVDNNLFKLTDKDGKQFGHSTEGSIALMGAGEETLYLKQCNPSITKRGYLCFEVPDNVVYDLHLSGGLWNGETAVVRLDW